MNTAQNNQTNKALKAQFLCGVRLVGALSLNKDSMKTAILTVDGKQYRATYDRMCNQGGYESRVYRWFVKGDDDYIGDFASLKEAKESIKQ